MDKSRIIAYTSPLYERLADESTKRCQLGATTLYGEME